MKKNTACIFEQKSRERERERKGAAVEPQGAISWGRAQRSGCHYITTVTTVPSGPAASLARSSPAEKQTEKIGRQGNRRRESERWWTSPLMLEKKKVKKKTKKQNQRERKSPSCRQIKHFLSFQISLAKSETNDLVPNCPQLPRQSALALKFQYHAS